MSLNDWLDKGWLVKHEPDKQEISDLLSVADRAISDAGIKGISTDAKLSFAHNASLQLAIAALAASGYRVGCGGYHYRAIQSLAFTIGLSTDLVNLLDSFRKKRNISEYERTGTVSEQEAAEMLALVKILREKIIVWLNKNHPELF